MVQILTDLDSASQEVAEVLEAYAAANPAAEIKLSRSNLGTIQILVHSAKFRGMTLANRHDEIEGHLDGLSDETFSQIGLLQCRAPGEQPILDESPDANSGQ